MNIHLVALNASFMHVNLALRQIQQSLPKAVDVRIHDLHINLPFRQIFDVLVREKPDVIGFSTYIWNAAYVFRLCRALRRALPDVILVLGGPEVSVEPEETLIKLPEVDFVLSGEGEITVPRLMEALMSGDVQSIQSMPGIAYRDGGHVVTNRPPDTMPPELWPDVWENGTQGLEKRILYTETSRGCPYRCSFCLSGSAGNVRALSAEESIKRLTNMADHGVQLIKLVDRTFNFDKARANAIWRGLIEHSKKRGLLPTYHFEISAQLLDDAAFEVLKDAPRSLFQFEAGIQSSDDNVLSNVGRRVSFVQLRKPLTSVMALNAIHLHVDLIAGLPGETMETFEKSFDDAYSIGAERLQLGFLKLLRGSKLRNESNALGIVYEPDPPYQVIRTRGLSVEELGVISDIEHALDWYYNTERYGMTLGYLLQTRTPFELFLDIARKLRNHPSRPLFYQQSEKTRASLLLELYDDEKLRMVMTHDMLTCSRRRDLPEALVFQEDEELRLALKEKYHPVRGQSAFRYAFDVTAFEQTGEWIEQETVILYD